MTILKICVISLETNQNYTEMSVWNGNYITPLENNEVAVLRTSVTEPPSPRSIEFVVCFSLRVTATDVTCVGVTLASCLVTKTTLNQDGTV